MKDIYRQRMLEVADLIETKDRFTYQYWTVILDGDGTVINENIVSPGRLFDDCNTAGCIGGWTAALAQSKLEFPSMKVCSTGDIGEFAAEYLGLDYYGNMALFHGRLMAHLGWYENDSEAMEKATGAEAAKLLRMIAYGEVEMPSGENPYIEFYRAARWRQVDRVALPEDTPTPHGEY